MQMSLVNDMNNGNSKEPNIVIPVCLVPSRKKLNVSRKISAININNAGVISNKFFIIIASPLVPPVTNSYLKKNKLYVTASIKTPSIIINKRGQKFLECTSSINSL